MQSNFVLGRHSYDGALYKSHCLRLKLAMTIQFASRLARSSRIKSYFSPLPTTADMISHDIAAPIKAHQHSSIHLARSLLHLPPKLFLHPRHLLFDILQEIPLIRPIRFPPNTLGPVGFTSRITPHVIAPAIVLFHLGVVQRRRLRLGRDLLVDQDGADGAGGSEEGVLARDTEVVAGFAMSDVSLLGAGVDEGEEGGDVGDVDVRPDVGA